MCVDVHICGWDLGYGSAVQVRRASYVKWMVRTRLMHVLRSCFSEWGKLEVAETAFYNASSIIKQDNSKSVPFDHFFSSNPSSPLVICSVHRYPMPYVLRGIIPSP